MKQAIYTAEREDKVGAGLAVKGFDMPDLFGISSTYQTLSF